MQVHYYLTLCILFVASCSCIPVIERQSASTEKGAAPSLDFSLATGSSFFRNGNKRKATLDLFPLQDSKKLQPEEERLNSNRVMETSSADWLSLRRPSSTSSSAISISPAYLQPSEASNPPMHLSPSKTLSQLKTSSLLPSSSQDADFSQASLSKAKKKQNRTGKWKDQRNKKVSKQDSLWQAWQEKGLGKHLTPAKLAKEVRRLCQIEGFSSSIAGKWINKSFKNDPEYQMKYISAQKSLTDRIAGIKKTFKQQNYMNFNSLEQSQQDEILLNHVLELDARKAALSEMPRQDAYRGEKVASRRFKEAALVARIGQVFENHFSSRQIDPTKLSSKDLEKDTRELQYGRLTGQRFQTLLHKYLKDRSGINDLAYKFQQRKHYQEKDVQKRREARESLAD